MEINKVENMAQKKALVITYYDAPNYGAFLQAYGTQCFLRSHGVDAQICRHIANKPTIITKLLDKRSDPEVIQYRNKLQAVIDEAQKYLHVTKGREIYDLAILGSDEIWNVKNLTAVHLPVFFQPYQKAKKTISYAACAGKCHVKHLKLLPYSAGIKKLDAVSVRDAHTENMLKDFGVESPVRTLDPTFLCDFEDQVPERAIREAYLLIYTYGLRPEEIEAIHELAKKENLKIVATGSACPWADENPVPSPFAWLSLIKHSQYVVTSTFHGSVFSIILNKQFAVIGTNSNKVNSLLDEMQLQKRKVNRIEELESVLMETICYDEINDIRTRKERESAAFILENL